MGSILIVGGDTSVFLIKVKLGDQIKSEIEWLD